jgi:hypothetical protein
MATKLSAIDDSATYYKYANEAQARQNQLAKAIEDKIRGAAQSLLGKAGPMGETLKFIGGSTPEDYKAADQAYDARQNQNEAESEDLQARKQAALIKVRSKK